MSEENDPFIYVWSVFSLLLALMLQMLPLPLAMAEWRPQFVLLVTFFWVFRGPQLHGVTFAWCCGLALDVMQGELLGRHALSFALCTYLLQLLQQRFPYMWVVHQLVLVAPLVLLHQLLAHSVTLLLHPDWRGELVLAPAVSSLLVWPLLVRFLSWLGDSADDYEEEEISSS